MQFISSAAWENLPVRRMLQWPQLVLWLNHQIEIISVAWACGTPAWGFDRWERLLRHLQTRAQGNSHQTSHVERHAHTVLYRSVKRVTRTFAGEKGKRREKVYGNVWRKGVRLCSGSPIVFSLESCICDSGFKLFLCKARSISMQGL